jgi:hypothetical protein
MLCQPRKSASDANDISNLRLDINHLSFLFPQDTMWNPRRLLLVVAIVLALSSRTTGQQYDDYDQGYGQDYTQDSLYHDYAVKQQQKEVGKA